MALAPADVLSPLGPLRRDTFRDVSETDTFQRVSRLLDKAAAVVAAKAPAGAQVDDAVEALTLGLAFDQAAGIWSGLAQEESVAGEVAMKYLSPDQLRKEAERYFQRYADELAQLTQAKVPSRTGRLRRT